MIAAMDLKPGDTYIDEEGCSVQLVTSAPSEDRLFITLYARCTEHESPVGHFCTSELYEMTHTFKVPGE